MGMIVPRVLYHLDMGSGLSHEDRACCSCVDATKATGLPPCPTDNGLSNQAQLLEPRGSGADSRMVHSCSMGITGSQSCCLV